MFLTGDSPRKMSDVPPRLATAARRANTGPRLWSMTVLPVVVVPVLASQTGGLTEWIQADDGWWAYGAVFLLAAIPWWEILLVVPPAIGLGLNPALVGVLAFLGNAVPVYLVVAAHERVTAWLDRRREKKDEKAKRSKRANRLFERYGLGGLAMAAPVLTGIHLATVIALALGAPPRRVAGWMTLSLAAWTAALVVASVVGFELFGVV